MLGNDQENDSDIQHAFDILDQQRRGFYDRQISIPDGLISPEELKAFLSILTDDVNFILRKEYLICCQLLLILVPC